MTPASTQRRVIRVHPGSFMSASLLNAGCGIRIDQHCAVRAVAACSAATCELAVRSRTRARAHSHRPLLNKARSTEAFTGAARACEPATAWVTCDQMWSGKDGTSRKSGTAAITLSLRNLAATTKERRAAMGGRCPVVSAVGRTGVEEHVVEVQWSTRKRFFSTSHSSPHGPKETELPCSFDQRLAVASHPRRLATVCREKNHILDDDT